MRIWLGKIAKLEGAVAEITMKISFPDVGRSLETLALKLHEKGRLNNMTIGVNRE